MLGYITISTTPYKICRKVITQLTLFNSPLNSSTRLAEEVVGIRMSAVLLTFLLDSRLTAQFNISGTGICTTSHNKTIFGNSRHTSKFVPIHGKWAYSWTNKYLRLSVRYLSRLTGFCGS